MKSIVLCFFIIASLAVNLVELYEYVPNTNYKGPNTIAGAPAELNYRSDINMVGKTITRRNAPDYFTPQVVKTSFTEDVQSRTERNKRHIPILGAHYYHHGAPIAEYPVAAPVPMVEETPFLPRYHYPYAAAYGAHLGAYGGHAVL